MEVCAKGWRRREPARSVWEEKTAESEVCRWRQEGQTGEGWGGPPRWGLVGCVSLRVAGSRQKGHAYCF